MKKMFAVALVLSASLAACGSKKEPTTPRDQPVMEQKGDATGGAAYGKKADAPPPADNKTGPNAPK